MRAHFCSPGKPLDRLIEYSSHHAALVWGAVLLAVFVIAYELRARQQSASSVTAQDAVRLMNQGALVLDIRTRAQFDAAHVNGARHIPAAELEAQADTLKKYREKPVVVYCESGNLAPSAIRRLTEKGFTRAVGLRGGLAAWRADSLPLTRT
jgi:rhodanese-related sulfurtransferase